MFLIRLVIRQSCVMVSILFCDAGDLGSSFKTQHMRIAVRKIALFDASFSGGTPLLIRPSKALANSSREILVLTVRVVGFFMIKSFC